MSRPSNRIRAPRRGAPKHRAPKVRRIGRNAVLPALAAAVVAAAVVSGPALNGTVGADGAEEAAVAALARVNKPSPASGEVRADPAKVAEMMRERRASTSRSDRRAAVDPVKAQALSQEAESGGQVTRTAQVVGGDPRQIAQALLPEFGFSADQFSCLDSLWTKESGWNVNADNPTSSAYGIPQALPGEKMASAGADWATNPATQIRWGLGYIAEVYGSPCSAWSHSVANNWY